MNSPFPSYSHVSVCRDCEFRSIGCHSVCEVYLSAKSKAQEQTKMAKKREEEYRLKTFPTLKRSSRYTRGGF